MWSLHCSGRRPSKVSERELGKRERDEGAPGVDRDRTQNLDAILVPSHLVRQDCRSSSDCISTRGTGRRSKRETRTRRDNHNDEHLWEAVYEPVLLERLLETASNDEHGERAEADDSREPVRVGERVLNQEEELVERRLGLKDVLELRETEHGDQLLSKRR